MSFLTQRFANSFPVRSMVRKDESSMGQKIFSLFSDVAEASMVDIVKVIGSFTLEKEDLEVHKIFKVELLDEDLFRKDESNDMIYTFPTVWGYRNGNKIELKRVEGSEGFIYGLPSSFVSTKTVPYSESIIYTNVVGGAYASKYNADGYWLYEKEFDLYERLFVTVEGSTLYKDFNNGTGNIPSSQLPFGGFTFVKLIGKDKFYNDISEYIKVNRDGEYRTKKVFRKLDKVEADGFNGSVEIRLSEATVKVPEKILKKNKFTIASNKIKSGICELSLSSQNVQFQSGVETLWYLDVYSRFVLQEKDFKQGGVVDESILRSKIAGILLVDKLMNFYTPVDFFISPVNSRVYILDTLGRVHISSLNLSPFLESSEKRTREITIESKLLTQRVPYGKDVRVKCELKKSVDVVKFWECKLVSPTNQIYLLKYSYNPANYSKSLTWLNSSQHNGTYKNEPLVDSSRKSVNLPVFNWNDFSYKINCDEIGQWDLFTTAYYDNQTFTHKTSFICEFLKPEVTLETGLSNVKGLFLSEENYIGIKTQQNFVLYKEVFDTYMADIFLGRILSRDKYEEIEVLYE